MFPPDLCLLDQIWPWLLTDIWNQVEIEDIWQPDRVTACLIEFKEISIDMNYCGKPYFVLSLGDKFLMTFPLCHFNSLDILFLKLHDTDHRCLKDCSILNCIADMNHVDNCIADIYHVLNCIADIMFWQWLALEVGVLLHKEMARFVLY